MPKTSKSKAATGRFVLLSDLHAHAWSAFSKGAGGENSRLKQSLLVLDQSLAKARELKVPWVFAGDIVHTAGYALNVVLSGLTDVLLRYPDIDKIAVWGNHDARGIGGKISFEQTVLATLSKVVPKFYVLDPSLGNIERAAGGITFSGAGYQPRSDLLEYGRPSDVGIYHQTVLGTKTPSGFVLEEGIPAGELTKRHRVSVVGHVHHWQYHPDGLGEVREGSQMILVPGSPEHQNFGDQGAHGWWIITLGETVEAVFMPGGSPEFRTVLTPSEVKNDGNFYRVSGSMNGTPLPDGAIAIASTPTVIESRNLLHGIHGDQVLNVWLKEEPPDTHLDIERYLAAGRTFLGPYAVGNLRALKLTQVRIVNFCSYEDQTFNVKPGTWLVVGRGRDFPSNGAGKSTLFEAVFWALFGRTTKGLTGDEVIRWGADSCNVSAYFELNGDEICVTRLRGEASRLVVTTPSGQIEGSSVNEMTEKLAKFLGITPELYQALGYFSQERLLLFASATDGERKDMLADLIGLSTYQAAFTAVNERTASLVTDIQKALLLKDTAAKRVAAETERLNTTEMKSFQWEEGRTSRALAACQLDEEFTHTLATTRERMMADTRARLGSKLVESQQAAQANFDAAGIALAAIEPETRTQEQLLAVQQEHALSLAEVKSKRALLIEVNRQFVEVNRRFDSQTKKLAEGKCPTCDQEITPEHKAKCLDPIRSELEGLKARTHMLEEGLQPAIQLAIFHQERVALVAAGVEAGLERDRLSVVRNNAQQVLCDVESQRAAVEKTAEWSVDAAIAVRIKELAQAVEAIRRERNPSDGEQDATRQRITEAEAEVNKHTAERIRLQEELAIADYWRRGFSKQGIQSLLVDEVAVLFNESRGSIFPALTQGVYDVQFSTMSQNKDGGWREKTEFQIFEHGESVPYAALSGGQKRRVDVGVMLTLVKAVSKWMQVPGMLGLLVLDEVFGFLDGSGAEGLMEVLRELQEQIPAIYVVSHDPQLQALFPEIIMVEQNQQGISHIVEGKP